MNEPEQLQEIKTRFKRSRLCRVIHVDGAWGSVTPQLNVHIAVYSEHRAFPEGTTIRAAEQGGLQDLPTENPGYIVREIDADLILSHGAATALRNWLNERLTELDAFQRQILTDQQTERVE